MLNIPHDIRVLAPLCKEYGIEAIGASAVIFSDEKAAAEIAAVMADNGLQWGLLPMPADFYFWDLSDDTFESALKELEHRAVIAEKLGISEATIYGVATFYENFSLEPKGKYVIKICDGTACHVRQSVPVLNALRKELGLSEQKKTTDDLLFTVETVSCLGACGLAPAMMINETMHPSMTPDKAIEIIHKLKEEA